MMEWKKYPYLIKERKTKSINKFKDRECYNRVDLYRFFLQLKDIPEDFVRDDFKVIHQEYNKLVQEHMIAGDIIRLPYLNDSLFIKRSQTIYKRKIYIDDNTRHIEIIPPEARLNSIGAYPRWKKKFSKGIRKHYCFIATSPFKKKLNDLMKDNSNLYKKYHNDVYQ